MPCVVGKRPTLEVQESFYCGLGDTNKASTHIWAVVGREGSLTTGELAIRLGTVESSN